MLPQCCSSMSPCFQGLLLGMLAASLLLAILISLWLTSPHKISTTNSITTQISTGKLLINLICSHCLPYAQIEQYVREAVFLTGFYIFPADLKIKISILVPLSVFGLAFGFQL